MKILVVRHGLSTNNVVMHEIGKMGVSTSEANRMWMDRRVDDPELTDRGKKEAEEFGAYYSRVFSEAGTSIKIYCSPFWRTLQTALPLANSVSGVHVVVQPDIYEIGGVYTNGVNGDKTGPGKHLSADEIKQMFPLYDVVRLPEGNWYTGGHETDVMAMERLERVVIWLKSPELHAEVGNSLLVLVVHGAFINLLFRSLLRMGNNSGPLNESGATLSFSMPNTGTSLVEIPEPGAEARVHWIGRTDHLEQREDAIKDALPRL
jgi:broad specificity phosphatase PhoE